MRPHPTHAVEWGKEIANVNRHCAGEKIARTPPTLPRKISRSTAMDQIDGRFMKVESAGWHASHPPIWEQTRVDVCVIVRDVGQVGPVPVAALGAHAREERVGVAAVRDDVAAARRQRPVRPLIGQVQLLRKVLVLLAFADARFALQRPVDACVAAGDRLRPAAIRRFKLKEGGGWGGEFTPSGCKPLQQRQVADNNRR